jgi:hypothetical protein
LNPEVPQAIPSVSIAFLTIEWRNMPTLWGWLRLAGNYFTNNMGREAVTKAAVIEK